MVFKEFNSFYEMKEWLMKGEYTLPSLYHIKNNGNTFIDYAIKPQGTLPEKIENIVINMDKDINSMDMDELDAIWDQIKQKNKK